MGWRKDSAVTLSQVCSLLYLWLRALMSRINKMQLGDKIRQFRISRKWTTRILSKKIGISQGMISRYERGEAFPRQRVLEKLAQVFEISLLEFLEEKPMALGSKKFDPGQFERSLSDLIRRLDDESKMLVLCLINELVEKRKYKDYYTKISQVNEELKP